MQKDVVDPCPHGEPTGSRRKLYAVDDDRTFLEVVDSVARAMDFDVVTVPQSATFKSIYGGESDAIVMIDMIMPEVDGIEVMNWMLSGKLPGAIIFVSGYDDRYPNMAGEIARQKGLKLVDTLHKPVTIARLRAALERARASTSDGSAAT